jgi:hypothetical protein
VTTVQRFVLFYAAVTPSRLRSTDRCCPVPFSPLPQMLAGLRERLVGQDAAIERLTALFEPLLQPTAWPRAVVPIAVVGSTGTGKTTMVRAAAAAIAAPLIEFDASAFAASELRERLRAAVCASLSRPGRLPPARIVLIENVLHAEPAGLLWLLGDRPAVYVADSSSPTPISRTVLVVTMSRSSSVDPLAALDPSVARHFTERIISFEPADSKHIPDLLDRRVRSANLPPLSAADRAAATSAFKPAFGYASVADSVDAIISRLRHNKLSDSAATASPAAAARPRPELMAAAAAEPAPPNRGGLGADPKAAGALPPSESMAAQPGVRADSKAAASRAPQADRFTEHVLDASHRRSNWMKHGFTVSMEPAARRLCDALHALAAPANPTGDPPANNDVLVHRILTHTTVWPLVASQRLPKVVVRDLVLLTHGARFYRSKRLDGTWSRHLLDRVWTKLQLPVS